VYATSTNGLFLRNEVYDFGKSLQEGGGIFLWAGTGTVGTLGNGNYTEIISPVHPLLYGLDHAIHGIGNFRNKNNIGATGNTGAKGQPAGVMPHDLDDNYAMVAVCRRMEAVYGTGGYLHCRIEPEGYIGHGHIIVDGFWQSDYVHALLGKPVCISLGASSTNTDKRIQVMLAVMVQHDIRHIHFFSADRHFMGFIAACAENRAAKGKDIGKSLRLEADKTIFHETPETVTKANDLYIPGVGGAFTYSADCCIEPGAVTACC
jgi:hypothetical protein